MNIMNGRGSTMSMNVVEPIRSIKDIQTIKGLLANKPRDLFLFVIGINSGLRVGDLLTLTVGDLKGIEVGEKYRIRESKTGKMNYFVMNEEIFKSFLMLMSKVEYDEDDFIFKSRRGDKAISLVQVGRLVKEWTKAINLKGNYGTRSLRKTFGYHQRITFGVSWEVLAKRFNHSHPKVTMRYIGVDDKEVEETLMNSI